MKFYNLTTHVRFRAVELTSGTIIDRLQAGYYCFWPYLNRKTLEDDKFTTNYTIYVFKEGYGQSTNYKHDVYLTEDELNLYLDWIRKTFKITHLTYSEIEATEGVNTAQKFPGYSIELTVEGVKRKHLWILNMIRMIYEYPFNLCLKEAFRLKGEKSNISNELKSEEFINMIQIILSAWSINASGYDFSNIYYYDQSPFYDCRNLVSMDYINTELDQHPNDYLLSIYHKRSSKLEGIKNHMLTLGNRYNLRPGDITKAELVTELTSYGLNIIQKDDICSTFNSELWLQSETSTIRDSVYEKVYSILNQTTDNDI